MPAKPNPRNWNDVQTAIAAVTVVITLGLWNLFAQPSKTVTAQSVDTLTPPPTEPPIAAEPAAIPQVKIMFTQVAPQNIVITQPQPSKKKNNNNSGGGGAPVTQTKTS